jgi:chemotaxis protein MotB
MLSRIANDRWLISYADFITLLFATFVLMYVAAKKNEQHPHAVAQGIAFAAQAHSIDERHLKPAEAPTVVPPVPSNLISELTNSLSLERSSHAVSLSSEPRGLVITLDDEICFEAGQAQIQPAAIQIFDKIGHILARYPNRVLLQGHTDSTPIHNDQFHSNWELSAARSIAVMELMEERAALRPERFLVAGAAHNTPVSSNETEHGRAQNRRVDVIVLDDLANAQAALVLSQSATTAPK